MRPFSLLFLAVLTAATCAAEAPAQKKGATKKEVAPSAQTAGGIKEVLAQYVGKKTNLGTLKKVTSDYFILDDDGSTVMHPLSTLHTIKISKDEESGETVVEIKLFAKD